MPTPVIAVDGPAAAGKGTLCRSLSAELGFDYLDTGLLYRAVGAALIAEDAVSDPARAAELAGALRFEDIDPPALRGEAVAKAASICAANPDVRKALFDFQANFAANPPGGIGAILDGRDIGTVVCPNADLKLWINASPEIRARRRFEENPSGPSYESVLASVNERDHREANRADAPMKPADDAVRIDTSDLPASEVLSRSLAAFASACARPRPGRAPKP